jgi:hypothetical protein
MIEIDLDNLGGTHSFNWTIQAMQNKFFTNIIRIRNENVLSQNILFDKLVVSPIIFNFISDSGGFGQFQKLNVNFEDYENPTLVGYILDHLGIWLDFNLPRYQCYLTLDSIDMRESKIEDLLSEEIVSKCYQVDIVVNSSVL